MISTLVPLKVIFKIVSKRLLLLTNKFKVINSEKKYPLRDYLEGYHIKDTKVPILQLPLPPQEITINDTNMMVKFFPDEIIIIKKNIVHSKIQRWRRRKKKKEVGEERKSTCYTRLSYLILA